jgi:hypothetical protein
MLRTSSSTTRTFLPASAESLGVWPSRFPFAIRRGRLSPVQQQHRFLQQALLGFRVPDHALPGKAFDGCFGLRAEPLGTAHDHRRYGTGFGLNFFYQLQSRNVGHPKIERDGVQVLPLSHSQGFPAGTDCDYLDIATAEALQPFDPTGFLGRHNQQLPGALRK